MNHFTTTLAESIVKGVDIREFFRQELENALNQLLKHELTVFLDYESYDPAGYNSGNSRNGYYHRKIKTSYGLLNITVPRDRMGEFIQQLLPSYKQTGNDLETTVIQLYKKWIRTREIADLIRKMYGHHYSPATISNITKLVDADVKAFHNRSIKERYVVIYCDTTFLSVRRDSVQKEAMHTLIGIDEKGHKEVLDYSLFPSESKENYRSLLQSLKSRGLKEVLVFVSDGLTGLRDAVLEEFPKAIQRSLYTNNIIENFNKRVKEHTKVKEQFPIENAFDRCACTI